MQSTILFDLDGTLLDSTDAIVGTCFEVFRRKNFKKVISEEDIKSTIGYPLEIMFEMLGADRELALEFMFEYKKIYRQISLSQTFLLPYTLEALEEASKFAKLAIVTTKTGAYTQPLLEHLKIDHFFEALVGREHVQNPKPHPEPILLALEILNIKDTANTWMIGDTKLDLISAKAANIKSIGVLCGYGKISELRPHSNHIFDHSMAAVEFIKNKAQQPN